MSEFRILKPLPDRQTSFASLPLRIQSTVSICSYLRTTQKRPSFCFLSYLFSIKKGSKDETALVKREFGDPFFLEPSFRKPTERTARQFFYLPKAAPGRGQRRKLEKLKRQTKTEQNKRPCTQSKAKAAPSGAKRAEQAEAF